MVWVLISTWQIWSFGKGWITPEALAVDSQGTVHLVYQSGDNHLVHAWFEGNSWPSETIGTCTSPPALRVGTADKGLHVIAGSYLTYYYRSPGGSGWFKKGLGYSSSDYDLLVINRPLIGFYVSYGKIYRGDGDTLGNFSVILIDSSYVEYYPPDPPYYWRYSYSVGGPVSVPMGGIIWYSISTDSYYYKKGSLVPNSCSYKYGDLEYEYYQYYDYKPCGQRVDDIACERGFLVYYNPKYECDYIRTYPMNDTIKGLFWGPDICKPGPYLLSAIGQHDRFPYLICGTNYYSIDTVRSISVSSIAATDTNNVFIAYVGYDSILRVAYGSLFGDTGEPPPPDSLPPPIFGSIILRAPSQSGGYIRFTAGASGLMDCSLYRADGTKAYAIAREVKEGEEIRIPVRKLGPGVYYLWIRIAGYEKRFRVVIL